jgi:hypothetical protein
MPFNGYDFIPKMELYKVAVKPAQKTSSKSSDMRGVRIVDVSGDVKLLISYRIRASIAAVLSIPMCIKLGPRFEAVDSLLHLHSVHDYARICFPTL